MCNVDADNILPREFAIHLNDLMHQHQRIIANYGKAPHNTKGRISMFRPDLLAVGGHDESFLGYGFEDRDLRDRLIASGCTFEWFDVNFARYIPHSDVRRVENLDPSHRDRRRSNDHNAMASQCNLGRGLFVANSRTLWGSAELTRNFSELITTGSWQPEESVQSAVATRSPAISGARYTYLWRHVS